MTQRQSPNPITHSAGATTAVTSELIVPVPRIKLVDFGLRCRAQWWANCVETRLT